MKRPLPVAQYAEELFEQRLTHCGVAFDRELPLPNGKRPDYWIGDPHELVCEVTTVQADFVDKYGLGPVFYDGSPPVYSKIKKKSRQGRGLDKLGLPYVVVIYSESWPLHHLDVMNAMFGRMPKVDLELPGYPLKDLAEHNAAVAPERRPWISAAAVMNEYRPAREEVERRLTGIDAPERGVDRNSLISDTIRQVGDDGWDFDRVECGFDVIRNPWCHVPLSGDRFRGDRDLQYDFSVSTQEPIFTGYKRYV